MYRGDAHWLVCSGIGYALAQRLLREDDALVVVLGCRNPEKAAEVYFCTLLRLLLTF